MNGKSSRDQKSMQKARVADKQLFIMQNTQKVSAVEAEVHTLHPWSTLLELLNVSVASCIPENLHKVKYQR